MPRVIPIIGQWPLTAEDLSAIPYLDRTSEFEIIRHEGTSAWFAIPGWNVITQAEDPIALLAQSDQLNLGIPDPIENVIVVMDRAQRQWNSEHYFITNEQGQLTTQWFAEEPNSKILGQIILIMRPQKVSTELENSDIWHIDE